MQIPSLRRMIGQMLLAGFPGAAMPDAQALRLMEEYSVGNFILFARNIGTALRCAFGGGLRKNRLRAVPCGGSGGRRRAARA